MKNLLLIILCSLFISCENEQVTPRVDIYYKSSNNNTKKFIIESDLLNINKEIYSNLYYSINVTEFPFKFKIVYFGDTSSIDTLNIRAFSVDTTIPMKKYYSNTFELFKK